MYGYFVWYKFERNGPWEYNSYGYESLVADIRHTKATKVPVEFDPWDEKEQRWKTSFDVRWLNKKDLNGNPIEKLRPRNRDGTFIFKKSPIPFAFFQRKEWLFARVGGHTFFLKTFRDEEEGYYDIQQHIGWIFDANPKLLVHHRQWAVNVRTKLYEWCTRKDASKNPPTCLQFLKMDKPYKFPKKRK